MGRILVVIFLFISMHYSYGQQFQLKGRIVADSLKGFAINIVNYTKKIGVTNTEDGYFEIPSSVNDSIIFSSVQYDVISHIVSEDDLENENFQVLLNPIVTKLDEVYVSNIRLTGNIEKDVDLIKIKPYFGSQVFGLPTKNTKKLTLQERRIYTASSGPLDLLLNTLNGKLKKLKKLKEFAGLDVIIKRGENAFSSSFFVEDLGVPEDLINDFVYYCAQDDYFKNLLKNTKKLTLLEFFKEKALVYKKLKQID